MTTKPNPSLQPPNLLRGILISCIGATLIVLLAVWFTISYQVEKLVINRTSEYAHSIAKIVADSSAEALLSEDILQLNLLVENVARDPYISRTTIYSEDGIVVSQFPPLATSTEGSQGLENGDDFSEEINGSNAQSSVDSSEIKQQQIFIAEQNNIPFIEKIAYQNVTAGWFKLEIDRNLLEQKFRESFVDIQVIIGSVAIVVFFILIFIVSRLQTNIRQLSLHCQHLLLQRKIPPPKNKKAWLASIKQLSEAHPVQLKEHINLPVSSDLWVRSKKTNETLVCFIEFSIPDDQEDDFAKHLTLAESYLSQAAQAYGIQSQGDILTGCLIPFEANPQGHSLALAISNALGFVALVKKLIRSLPIDLKLRACLCKTPVLQLEDQHDLITGISVPSRTIGKIRRVFLEIAFSKISCLSFDESELLPFACPQPIVIDGLNHTQCFLLTKIAPSITKQNALKFKHIAKA